MLWALSGSHVPLLLSHCGPCLPSPSPATPSLQLLVALAFMLEAFVFTRYAYQLKSVRTWFDHLWNKTLHPVNRYVSVSQLGLDW